MSMIDDVKSSADPFMAAGIAMYAILASKDSIKNHIDEIAELWKIVGERLSDNEVMALSNAIKTRVQEEVVKGFYDCPNQFGAALMATGTGKSKIAIDIANTKLIENPTVEIMLVVPTEKLRDEGWKDEFEKWNSTETWKHTESICYASLSKVKGRKIGLLILDEGHRITENNSEFFSQNEIDACILITATKPDNPFKIDILKEIGIFPFFRLSLDEAVKLGIVAPYSITVITTRLDETDKYIKAGSKAKPFMTTEKEQYRYLSSLKALKFSGPMGVIKRMRFLYNLKSKTQAALDIINNALPSEARIVIFCGSKEQANKLCSHRFYSKPTPPKKPKKETPAAIDKYTLARAEYVEAIAQYQGDTSLKMFIQHLISRISCCDALDEGHNLPLVDIGFIVQLKKSELGLIQRTGRFIRFRPGHTGKIIILCVGDTVDENWTRNALSNFNPENIQWIELSRLRMGIEKINF